jgi:hypothetical protein
MVQKMVKGEAFGMIEVITKGSLKITYVRAMAFSNGIYQF